MSFDVEKVGLPEDVSKEMNLWRKGFGSIGSYVEFHKGLAKKRLKYLQDNYGLTVHSVYMVSDGWGDGMRAIQSVIETRSGNLLKLKWMDANQDFAVDKIGTSMLFEKDLV